eukprot:1924383-Alexandrium_andersonii.AAC.1
MSFFALRGGKRQRLARALALGQASSASAGPVVEGSSRSGPLDGDAEVDLLVELYALGIISAK